VNKKLVIFISVIMLSFSLSFSAKDSLETQNPRILQQIKEIEKKGILRDVKFLGVIKMRDDAPRHQPVDSSLRIDTVKMFKNVFGHNTDYMVELILNKGSFGPEDSVVIDSAYFQLRITDHYTIEDSPWLLSQCLHAHNSLRFFFFSLGGETAMAKSIKFRLKGIFVDGYNQKISVDKIFFCPAENLWEWK
jgi:hypothetical protein